MINQAKTNAKSVIKKNIKATFSFLKTRFSRSPNPIYLSHLVTTRCNANCPYCHWKNKREKEMTAKEIRSLYKEAKKVGFIFNHIWGGEPLLREDICEIVEYSKEEGFITSLVTNGFNLSKNHNFIPYLDLIIVSLDAPDERHDKIRQKKGLFKNAIEGIETIRSLYPNLPLYICSVLSSLNRGVIPQMMELALRYNAQIYFCPVGTNLTISEWGDQTNARSLQKTPKELIEDFKLIKEYKQAGYPVQSSYFFFDHYIKGGGKYKCYRPRVYLNIYPNGDVETCFYGIIGNVKERELKTIIQSYEYKDAVKRAESCSEGCHANDAIELSGLWHFNLKSLLNWV